MNRSLLQRDLNAALNSKTVFTAIVYRKKKSPILSQIETNADFGENRSSRRCYFSLKIICQLLKHKRTHERRGTCILK